jgi:hypothetical protein
MELFGSFYYHEIIGNAGRYAINLKSNGYPRWNNPAVNEAK